MTQNLLELTSDFRSAILKIAPESKVEIKITNLPMATVVQHPNKDGMMPQHTRTEGDVVVSIFRTTPEDGLELESVGFNAREKNNK